MSGMRVMVVTEHPVFREILTNLIEDRGFEVYPAADGIDALRQIYHVVPRVIVSDAALPNLSGFELLPFVRRRFPEIGVIALWEKRCTDEHAAEEFADVILSVDPFNPELLSDALLGLMADYPFRTTQAGNAAGQVRAIRQLNGDSKICPKCERLQLHASVARMNSLLSNVWRQLRPGDEQAEEQNSDAEDALRKAFSELESHRLHAHGASRPDHIVGSDSAGDEQARLRCANG